MHNLYETESKILAFEGATSMTMKWAIIFGLSAIAAAPIVYGTVRKGRWGINLASVSCPRCAAALPWLRMPRNDQQANWGGWTCRTCGAEIDKWGRTVALADQTRNGRNDSR